MAVEIPQHSLSIRDGGLGLVSETAEGVFIIVGPSTAGVAGSFYTFRGPDTSIVFDTLGSGILPDQVAKHLIHSGGKTVIAYKANASTAGSNSAVTQTGGGPVVTLTGTPDNQGELVMEILTGGALGTKTFVLLDGQFKRIWQGSALVWKLRSAQEILGRLAKSDAGNPE